jgi:HEAT repeat protein
LDVLIACIDCNNGLSGLSFDRFPALKAITMIGPEAVPKLTEALRDGRPTTRSYAAVALGEIGGSDAKKALDHALLSERDKEVVISIQIALRKQ